MRCCFSQGEESTRRIDALSRKFQKSSTRQKLIVTEIILLLVLFSQVLLTFYISYSFFFEKKSESKL